jgi:hypothetical protein
MQGRFRSNQSGSADRVKRQTLYPHKKKKKNILVRSPPTTTMSDYQYPYFNPPDITTTDRQRSNRIKIAHPYARLFAKTGEVKRRKIWNHALEKSLFSPYEL